MWFVGDEIVEYASTEYEAMFMKMSAPVIRQSYDIPHALLNTLIRSFDMHIGPVIEQYKDEYDIPANRTVNLRMIRFLNFCELRSVRNILVEYSSHFTEDIGDHTNHFNIMRDWYWHKFKASVVSSTGFDASTLGKRSEQRDLREIFISISNVLLVIVKFIEFYNAYINNNPFLRHVGNDILLNINDNFHGTLYFIRWLKEGNESRKLRELVTHAIIDLRDYARSFRRVASVLDKILLYNEGALSENDEMYSTLVACQERAAAEILNNDQ